MYVSLVKHYVSTDERALRAALSDARGVIAEQAYRLERAQREGAQSIADGIRWRDSAIGNADAAYRSRLRAQTLERALPDHLDAQRSALIAAHGDGRLTLDTLRVALDACGLAPYAPVKVYRTFTVSVDIAPEDFVDEQAAHEHVSGLLRDAMEDALMSEDAALSWRVNA